MQNTLNIRSIVEQELQQKGYNLSRFSQVSGMNRGTLSLILNGNPSKLPSIPQMDKIAEALGYEQGWLYELYLEECFDREVPHWRRLKNFLYRCIQLDKEELIDKALYRLMEDCSQTAAVFDAAEEWYEEGHRQILLPFYRYVTVNEKYRHAERLAVSHYRIFRLSQSENFENNLRAAITFEPYRHELPVGFRLDGLLKLANIYFNQHMWEKVEFFADELRELAMEAYKNKLHIRQDVSSERGLKTERHLVVYYGQGYLLKGNSLEKQQKYKEAMHYVLLYKDLSWFEGLNFQGEIEVNKFCEFSYANLLNLRILQGDKTALPEYITFLKERPMEILSGLLTILDSANKYEYFVDDILDQFANEIYKFENNEQIDGNYYSNTFIVDRYIGLHRKLAVYFFRKFQYNDGINSILISLELSIQVNDKKHFSACIAMFEIYKEHSVLNQQKRFQNIMREVLFIEESRLSSPAINDFI